MSLAVLKRNNERAAYLCLENLTEVSKRTCLPGARLRCPGGHHAAAPKAVVLAISCSPPAKYCFIMFCILLFVQVFLQEAASSEKINNGQKYLLRERLRAR